LPASLQLPVEIELREGGSTKNRGPLRHLNKSSAQTEPLDDLSSTFALLSSPLLQLDLRNITASHFIMTPSSPLTDTEAPAVKRAKEGSKNRSGVDETVEDWQNGWVAKMWGSTKPGTTADPDGRTDAMMVDENQARAEDSKQPGGEGLDALVAAIPDDGESAPGYDAHSVPSNTSATATTNGNRIKISLKVRDAAEAEDDQPEEDDVSSITSTTIPFNDSGSEGSDPAGAPVPPGWDEMEVEEDGEGEADVEEKPVKQVPVVLEKKPEGPAPGANFDDDSVSELTAFTDESEGEAGDDDDDEDDDEDEEDEEEEEEAGRKDAGASVPPPNANASTTTGSSKTSPTQPVAQKPLSARKPSIFGTRSDEPEGQDDGEESELTDSDVESTTTATMRNKPAINNINNNKGVKPISIKVTPAKSTTGDDDDEPTTPTATTASGNPASRRLSKAGDDEEKPYSPPKTAKKGILGRSAAGAGEGETESIVSDDEEEDDDEGGQGMLVKDAVRRESEGKAKKTSEDEDDDEDKGVAGERSLEERGKFAVFTVWSSDTGVDSILCLSFDGSRFAQLDEIEADLCHTSTFGHLALDHQ
jgi:hypothetical protein